MRKSERLKVIDTELNRLYPKPEPALYFETPYQMLVAVILSAQCTDERVNKVTAKLFADHPGPKEVLDLGVEGLKKYIKSCGLFNSKSKNIIAMTKDVLEQYGGDIPRDFQALQKLAGVGEKTAGVVMAQCFGEAQFPVDTHIFRLAHRLGLSKAKTPNKVSADLKKAFPKERWSELHLQIIFHGRQVCDARKPRCSECSLLAVCPEGTRRVKKVRLSDIEIRPIRQEERAMWLQVCWELLAREFGIKPYTKKILQTAVQVWAAFYQDAMVGTVLLDDDRSKSDECSLHYLGVREAWRGKKIGEQLASRVFSLAKEKGFKKCFIDARTLVMPFYEKFDPVHTGHFYDKNTGEHEWLYVDLEAYSSE